MKKLLLAFSLLLCTSAVNAQDDIFDNPDNHPYLGARLGIDITSTGGSNTGVYNNGTGFSVGAVYNIPLYMNLYFEPGLSVFYDTFGYQNMIKLPAPTPDDPNASIPYFYDASIRNFGFRIPMLVGFNFDFVEDLRVASFTGPQGNLNLVASYHKQSVVDPNHSGSIFGEYGFKHADFQWVIGVGVSYQKYYVSIAGGIGMTRVRNLAKDHFRRNTFNISLGYNF